MWCGNGQAKNTGHKSFKKTPVWRKAVYGQVFFIGIVPQIHLPTDLCLTKFVSCQDDSRLKAIEHAQRIDQAAACGLHLVVCAINGSPTFISILPPLLSLDTNNNLVHKKILKILSLSVSPTLVHAPECRLQNAPRIRGSI